MHQTSVVVMVIIFCNFLVVFVQVSMRMFAISGLKTAIESSSVSILLISSVYSLKLKHLSMLLIKVLILFTTNPI